MYLPTLWYTSCSLTFCYNGPRLINTLRLTSPWLMKTFVFRKNNLNFEIKLPIMNTYMKCYWSSPIYSWKIKLDVWHWFPFPVNTQHLSLYTLWYSPIYASYVSLNVNSGLNSLHCCWLNLEKYVMIQDLINTHTEPRNFQIVVSLQWIASYHVTFLQRLLFF